VTLEHSPLFLAAASGNLDSIKELAPDADTPDLNKSLAQASALSQFEAADALLAAGAEANGEYDPLYGTVLFPACEFLNPDGIAYLLKHGADPGREVLRIDGPRNALTHL
jgi:ankyrin repeat protein